MIAETVTIAAILGGSAAAVWFVKTKFQPEIDRSLGKIEEIVARRKSNHTH